MAGEIYETLTLKGTYTNLFTGQEYRDVPFSTHTSGTMETCPLDEDFEVCVIDEIQMISDEDRGHAWTKALLGIRAKEIHVCGGLEASSLVKKIAADCGDTFELRTYSRFADLKVESKSIAQTPSQSGCYKQVSLFVEIHCYTKPLLIPYDSIGSAWRLRGLL